MRFRLWLVISLLCCGAVSAQPYPPMRIRQFRGIETKLPEYMRGYNPENMSVGATLCHNFDLSRGGLGTLTKRLGYDKVTTIQDVDSIVGIYGAYYSDGTQQMVLVVDPDSTDYGQIWLTDKGDVNLHGATYRYDTVTVAKWPAESYDSVRYRIIYGSDTMILQQASGSNPAQIATILIDSCNTFTGITCSTCVPANKYLVKYDTIGATQTAAYGSQALATGGGWTTFNAGSSYHTYKTIFLYSGVTIAWNKFSVQNKPSFAMLNDNVWIVNGDQKGVVVNGEHQITRSFPIPAPGEPLIVPYSDTNTAYRISGQVRYVMEYRCYKGATGYTSDLGYTTQPVNVQNGHVLITGFPPPASDSIMDDVDSIQVFLYRSVENPGRLDPMDSAYCIDTISLGTANFDDVVYIDSLPESSVGSKDRTLFDWDYVGRDSLYAVADSRRPGAPGFSSTAGTLSYTLATDTTRRGGIFHGIPGQQDTLGVMYACTFIDTVIGVESDTGRSLAIYVDSAKGNDQGAIPLGYTVRLPKIPESDSGIVVNLYRANIMQITYDTTIWRKVYDFAGRRVDNRDYKGDLVPGPGGFYAWVTDLAVDSISTSQYFLVAQIPSSDTVYTDTIRFDSLSVKRPFRRTSPPPLLQGLFSYQGRLFGWHGSNLYWSLLDSAYAWGAFDFISVNADDGDQITVAYPTRQSIRTHKNNASFNVYQNSDGNWYLSEISSNRGCVGPYSHVVYGDNHYYIGRNYAWAEFEAGDLDRRFGATPLSARIDNFDNLTITQKRNTVAMPWENHVIFKVGDTSYVWDEKAQAWSTWSLNFDGWTMYGTETSTEFIPGDTLYFFEGANLYRYGTSENDDSTTISIRYQTGPIFSDELDYYKQLDVVGLSVNSDDETNSIYVAAYNHLDSALSTGIAFSSLSTKRYSVRAAYEGATASYGENHGLFFYLVIGANVTTTLGNTIIDGVDLWATKKDRVTVE